MTKPAVNAAAMPLPTAHAGIMAIKPYVGGKSKAAPGVVVRKLSSNESPLGPSPKAVEAYRQAADSLHRYPDGSCQPLREAIAETYHLPVDQIVCGAGSDELIGLLIHAYAAPGDEVLYSQYGFLMYKIYAQGFGAVPVAAPEKAFETDVDAILRAVTPRTKLVFIANPNNPTGSYISAAELARLRTALPSHVLLVVDGAYSEYVDLPDYSDGTELALQTPNTVMLRTFSKIYGLSSLRLGWALCPPAIADVLNRVRGPFNVSTPAMAAGTAAVRDVAFTQSVAQHNRKALAELVAALTALQLPCLPSVGNFVLVRFAENGPHSAANANQFLMERGIIVRDTVSYGLPEYLRISVGLDEDNQAVIKALTAFLQ